MKNPIPKLPNGTPSIAVFILLGVAVCRALESILPLLSP